MDPERQDHSSVPPVGPEADPATTELARCLQRIVEGDRTAQGELYEQFSSRIYRRILSRFGRVSWIDSDDLLQDTFISAYQNEAQVLARVLERHGPTCDESHILRALWSIACGLASNRHRAESRRPQHLHAEHHLEDVQDGPEGREADRETLARLAQCIRRKGGRVYLYYRLRYVDGYTPEEIARLTGWSRKVTYNLKLALNRALERCCEQLKL